MGRIAATIAAMVLYGLVDILYTPRSSLWSGQSAGRQFDNSDAAFISASYWMHFFSGTSALLTLALLVVLLIIWIKPLLALINRADTTTALMAVLTGAALLSPAPAHAYYDKTDITEIYFILPNESAFFIPDAGANKDNQASFGSESYLRDNKIAAKRFQIPHGKLSGSSLWADFYVPTGRLIIVDRAPFSREWVAQAHRGTSPRDESFPCQSKEGINIAVGMAIGASVSEENSPKFLYRFGVKSPPGDRSRPEIIFTSVYYGRSLAEVMDGPVRSKVQSLVCDEFTRRSFDDGNAQAAEILVTIEKNVGAYLANVGITLDYIGWADTFTFDKIVQDAINRRYVASQDQAIAQALAPYADTIQKLAAAEALRAFGLKADGKLPTTIVGLPPDVGGLLGTLLRSGPPPPAGPAPAAPR